MEFVGHGFVRGVKYINFYKWLGFLGVVGSIRLDSYVEYSGGGSSVEYIVKRLKERSELHFWDSATFLDLEKEGLTGEGMVVRTSNNGQLDKCYVISGDGKFDTMCFDSYPMHEQIFDFGEVFASKNIGDGYTLEWRKFEGLFREWYKLNKK